MINITLHSSSAGRRAEFIASNREVPHSKTTDYTEKNYGLNLTLDKGYMITAKLINFRLN